MRILICWGLYGGPPIPGNYQMLLREQGGMMHAGKPVKTVGLMNFETCGGRWSPSIIMRGRQKAGKRLHAN